MIRYGMTILVKDVMAKLPVKLENIEILSKIEEGTIIHGIVDDINIASQAFEVDDNVVQYERDTPFVVL